MKHSILIPSCAVILLVIATCGCTAPGTHEPVYAPEPSPTPPHVLELSGTTWYLFSYLNESGAGQPVIEGTTITAVFNESLGELSGNAGCNHYTARYTVDGDSLQIHELAWTEMYCTDPPGVMRQETEYLTALERTTAFYFTANQLSLTEDNGEVLLVYEAGEPPERDVALNGTAWHLVSLAAGPGEVGPVLEGTRITAIFGEDGNLGGSAGCNRYTTNFTQEGNTIGIGHVATTLAYCAEPVGVMKQETTYLTALESAVTAERENGRLVMSNAAGEAILIFEEGA
jgi:heat shock protein HslJ